MQTQLKVQSILESKIWLSFLILGQNGSSEEAAVALSNNPHFNDFYPSSDHMTFRTIGPLISRMPHDYLMWFSSLFSHKTLLLALFLSKSHRHKASYGQPEYLHLQEDVVLQRMEVSENWSWLWFGEMKMGMCANGRVIAPAAREWSSLQALLSEITLKGPTQ